MLRVEPEPSAHPEKLQSSTVEPRLCLSLPSQGSHFMWLEALSLPLDMAKGGKIGILINQVIFPWLKRNITNE